MPPSVPLFLQEADEDDSFFELEIALPPGPSPHPNMLCKHKNILEDKNLSKRKILPIDRPHSPISLLMSARVFAFSKSNLASASKETQPLFTRSGSLRKCDIESGDQGASGRFSRDVIHKYLRLVKPLYTKASKKKGNNEASAEEYRASASPPLSGSRSKQFGKSRSASAATTRAAVSPGRMDDSLLQQHDGIQSAILHCKRSFRG